MKKADAIDFFGSQNNLAKELGITHSAISQWGEDVPPLRAFEIARLTEGKLSIDSNLHSGIEQRDNPCLPTEQCRS
jgi:DNA-binding transcriptional regulator YdaS (Cro superfamily)